MLNRIILWSLKNRLVVLALAILLIVFGVRAARQSPLDVFPDFAPPQVVIQTEARGLSPEEVEQLVLEPGLLAGRVGEGVAHRSGTRSACGCPSGRAKR